MTAIRDNNSTTPERAFGNSYHSVFVWQDGPRAYLVASDNVELSDVDIFDITDPENPVQVGDHDLVELFPEIMDGERRTVSSCLHHDMVVKHIDGKPILKSDYWDAGYVQMDVSDPANPVLVNDTTFAAEDPLLPGSDITPEGNAHQGEFSHDNQFLLAADEDFSAFRNIVRATSGATNGRAASGNEGDAVARVSGLPDQKVNGPVEVRRRRLRPGDGAGRAGGRREPADRRRRARRARWPAAGRHDLVRLRQQVRQRRRRPAGTRSSCSTRSVLTTAR